VFAHGLRPPVQPLRLAPPGPPKKKGRIAPALSCCCDAGTWLRADLPAQEAETHQGTAQEHQGRAAVRDAVKKGLALGAIVATSALGTGQVERLHPVEPSPVLLAASRLVKPPPPGAVKRAMYGLPVL